MGPLCSCLLSVSNSLTLWFVLWQLKVLENLLSRSTYLPAHQRCSGSSGGQWETCGLHPHLPPISSQSTGLLGDCSPWASLLWCHFPQVHSLLAHALLSTVNRKLSKTPVTFMSIPLFKFSVTHHGSFSST